jgi:hypothetical protein
MARWFNTAGPNRPEKNYTLPALRRLPTVRDLIERESYFVLHAPRQFGKTTAFMALAEELTREGRYAAALVSVEGASTLEEVGDAELAILSAWWRALEIQLPKELTPSALATTAPASDRIADALYRWSVASPRPVVLFIDEIDALRGPVLVSLLRQIRSGYPRRGKSFPHSLALIGMRDVREYKLAAGGDGDSRSSSSPFNIKVESLSLPNFGEADVAELFAQHTTETGQSFTPEAVSRAYELTQGQPWLVNAIAKQLVETLVPNRSQAIGREQVDRAKELLIQRQDTHLDSLAE